MVRIKHRYLLVNFLYPTERTQSSKEALPDVVLFNQPSSDELTISYLTRLIRTSVADIYGDYGAGAVSTSLQVKYLSTATSTAIIRAPRNHYRLVWGALSFITELPSPINQPCVVRVVRVSGTIRKSEDEVIKRSKELVMRVMSAKAATEKGLDGFLDQLVGDVEPPEVNMDGIEDDTDDDAESTNEDEEEEDLGEPMER